MKKFFLSIIFLCAFSCVYATIIKNAIKVSVIQTNHYDIVFVPQSIKTAKLIAEHCDSIYEKARNKISLKKDFRVPIVISPNSDRLDVSYTPLPYNRIVIYDSVPTLATVTSSQFNGDESLLKKLEREIIRSIAQSYRSPFIQIISDVFSNVVQPSYLVNMPLSYFEGISETFLNDEVHITDDYETLQLLALAKLEGNFPSWLQVSGARDIFPYKEIARAAGSAFAAFIQQRWGVQKYIEFWQTAGHFNFFILNAGIFKKVYGISLNQAWKDFKEAIPLPSQLVEIKNTNSVFKHEGNELPSYIMQTTQGVVFYDEARNEVTLVNENKKRKRLFVATDITNLTLSNDGNFIAVSFFKEDNRDNFVKNCTRVYDLKAREFLDGKYPVRCGAVINLDDKKIALAGIKTHNDRAELCVYECYNDDDYEQLFCRSFEQGYVPRYVFSLSKNTVGCVVTNTTSQVREGNDTLLIMDLKNSSEKTWTLPNVSLRSLKAYNNKIVFTYILKDEMSFTRTGIISFDKSAKTNSNGNTRAQENELTTTEITPIIFMQQDDAIGGINDSFINDKNIFYTTRHFSYKSLKVSPCASIQFEQSELATSKIIIPKYNELQEEIVERSYTDKKGKVKSAQFLGNNKIAKYNPYKYMFHGTWIPMLPIYSFGLDKEYKLSPGLGVTYITKSDLLDCAESAFSFGTAFLDLSKNYTQFINDFSLAAFTKISVLPVDITLGGTWRFNKNGKYTLQVLAGTRWNMPLTMTYQHWAFDIKALWTSRTEYEDETTKKLDSVKGWTGPYSAYNNLDLSIGCTYNNYHQAGLSAYEQLGFEAGGSLILSYNYGKEKFLHDNDLATNGFTYPTSLAFSLDFGLKLPRLIPMSYKNGFVFGLPLTIHSTWNGEPGVTWRTYAEVLLFGWESQLGLPFVNLYLNRFGLKFGYEYNFKYDSLILPPVEFTKLKEFREAINSSHFESFLYLTAEGTLCPVVGFLTKLQMTFGAQFKFYLYNPHFDVSFLAKVKF